MTKSSHSEIESFALCERRHFYNYGMGLTGTTVSESLYRGQCGHAGLAGYYTALQNGLHPDDAYEAGFKAAEKTGEEMETYNKTDLNAEVELLLAEYFDHYEDIDAGIEVLAVEHNVRVPTSNGNTITVVVDLIKREPGVGIVLVDHKFTYEFFNPESIDLNPQLVKYMAALRMENIPVARLEYNEIRTRKTKDNQIDPSKKFMRTPFKPTKARIKNTMREHFIMADRIIELRESGLEAWEDSITRVANKMVCQSCPFKDICINDLNEWGRENLLLHDYKVREITPDVEPGKVEVNGNK